MIKFYRFTLESHSSKTVFLYLACSFQIQELQKNDGLDALKDHPAVKRVTAQRMVIRHLHYINDTEEDIDSDMWDDVLYVNVSESGEKLVLLNITQTDMTNSLDGEDKDEVADDTVVIDTGIDYVSYLSETESNDIKSKPKKKDEPCNGADCKQDVNDHGTWTASRPLRRSSLTLVSTVAIKLFLKSH